MIQLESIEFDYFRSLKLSLTSKCQVSPERTVLYLESEVNQRIGFYSHHG